MRISTEAKVGAVTIVGIILLALIVIHLSGFSVNAKGYPVQVVFTTVNGLKSGNLVRYAGVEVGRVQAVAVKPTGVQVELLLNQDVTIPQGSKFGIGTDGLLGEKYIDITPAVDGSAGQPIKSGEVVRGEEPQGMDKLVSTATQTLVEVQRLVQSLNEVLTDQNIKTAMKDTAINAKEITANLQTMSAVLARMAVNNERDVTAIVNNLAAMSNSLRQVTARVDAMAAGVDNNGRTAADLRETIANIRATSARVEKMAASLENVVTDPENSKNIKETLKNAKSASEKADKMLNKLGGVSAQSNVEMLYSNDNKRYKSSADIRIATSPSDFAVIGLSDIGEGNRVNLQLGKGNGQNAKRFGIIDSRPGFGVDTRLGDRWSMSVDMYDPNDFRVKLRSQYQLSPGTYLVGQTDSINKHAEQETYFGIRTAF